jgi:hypothetical protein
VTVTQRLADKYIERGGYMPGERRERHVEDLLAVLSFVGWHEPGHLQGGVRAGEAFLALCRLLNLEPAAMRKIIRGQED